MPGNQIRRRSSLKGPTKDKLIAKLQHLFDEADHDGGGTVDKIEMMNLLRENKDKLCKVVPALKSLDFHSSVCSEALFIRFDVDGDGELDKKEFVDGFVYEARCPSHDARAAPARLPAPAPRGSPAHAPPPHPVSGPDRSS